MMFRWLTRRWRTRKTYCHVCNAYVGRVPRRIAYNSTHRATCPKCVTRFRIVEALDDPAAITRCAEAIKNSVDDQLANYYEHWPWAKARLDVVGYVRLPNGVELRKSSAQIPRQTYSPMMCPWDFSTPR